MAVICERWLLPSSGDIRLADDWNNHSYVNDMSYLTLREDIHTQTTAADLGLDDYRGSYIWQVVVDTTAGPDGGVSISSASAMSTVDSSNELVVMMVSHDY